MDYVKELLEAVNTYNENNVGSREKLRNLVCVLSEDVNLKKDPLVLKLLYIASQKMRVFGYNYQNKFENDPDMYVRSIDSFKNEEIAQAYQSEISLDVILDKSQKEIVDFFNSLTHKRMLVSAPTSYGKTFLMREILYHNKDRYKNIILVFPTIALLRENASEMTSLIRQKELDYQVVISVDSNIDPEGRNIFIYTPERTIQLLTLFPQIKIDFCFYDEVYKIDEGYRNDYDLNTSFDKKSLHKNIFDDDRTKTFRISLYLLSKSVLEYYLAGPNLKQEKFGNGMKTFLNKNKIEIREIDFEPTVRIPVNAYGVKIEEKHPFTTPFKTAVVKLSKKKGDKILDIANYINTNEYGKTLYYCRSPASTIKYAKNMAELEIGATVHDRRLLSFLDHVERAYDISGSAKEWSLIDILKKGIAIHNGNLPRYVQAEILDQFNKGSFRNLFCTSTIIEGVNTNARNIVILNPTKGQKRLTAFDIKNIGGRAGRYYHNFVGRIFYADKSLLEILDSDMKGLNFTTYDEQRLDGIDLDNAEMPDLDGNNVFLKKKRIETQKGYSLPRNIFEKNRLIPYECQENLLQIFLKDDEEFNKFKMLIRDANPAHSFVKYNYLGKILESFKKAGLIDESIRTTYTAIGLNYLNEGFKGILNYEINKARREEKNIDQAYGEAFGKLRNIIEYKIPKMISLFESVFVYATELRGISMPKFNLSKATRFYETGVSSPFGEELIEFGFPIDTVRNIESEFTAFLSLDIMQSKTFYKSKKEAIHTLLDDYEKLLIEEAVGNMLRY